jgi:Ni/Co efflux regulator RcnB
MKTPKAIIFAIITATPIFAQEESWFEAYREQLEAQRRFEEIAERQREILDNQYEQRERFDRFERQERGDDFFEAWRHHDSGEMLDNL